jgi:hypothetical protein
MEPDHVKSPNEIVAQQSSMAPGAKKSQDEDYDDEGYVDSAEEEQKKKFDERQATIELKRAARSAATCGGVVEGGPLGKATVTLTFSNEGHVKESSIAPPFAETSTGKCVLRAMAAVIVPNYVGPEKTMDWEIDVTGEKKADKEEE